MEILGHWVFGALGMAMSIWSFALLGNKNINGWIVGIIGNACWICYTGPVAPISAVFNVVLAGYSVNGWMKWKKSTQKVEP
jgi:hypothetical protein